MGAFQNPNFVAEFTYRTKINYYNLRLLQETNIIETQRIRKCIDDLHDEMKKREYEIADFYEVTHLINSLTGLLVFPEQEALEKLPDKEEAMSAFPELSKCIEKDKTFEFDYLITKKKYGTIGTPERKTPRNIIRHLRNAVSHDQLGIYPVNGRLKNGENVIKSVVFEDKQKWMKKKDDYVNMHFKLQIDVEDLEMIFIEICDALLRLTR